ncbi:hypothetical protein F0562_002883 [Nyssa sinensis]|uniref:Uncharacterized protein n=1 Tax=Nyssa sinensis TaxID=561372 RepID=A0A5J5BUD0_9ASTE|nr:hypothetical protein F0562_002883 [Nyssa sinensis]
MRNSRMEGILDGLWEELCGWTEWTRLYNEFLAVRGLCWKRRKERVRDRAWSAWIIDNVSFLTLQKPRRHPPRKIIETAESQGTSERSEKDEASIGNFPARGSRNRFFFHGDCNGRFKIL